MTDNRDIQVIIILVFLTVLFILLPPLSVTPIRTILAIPMVLFLPGYALIAALFPKVDDLDGIERLALSFGLSIAVVPLMGLVLNFTPYGIRLFPILLSLSFFTIFMSTLAFLRRSKLAPNERFTVPFSSAFLSFRKEILSQKSGIDKILTVILILSILTSIAVLIYVIVTPKQGEKFTEFYILGTNGKADNYSTDLAVGKNSSIIIGIINHEYVTTNYTLDVSLENDTIETIPVKLEDNSTWENKIYFKPDRAGDNLKLQFLLYKENNFTSAYRDLHLWVNVSST